jgi:hypothetical protein
MEKSPMDDSSQGFPISAYCSIPLWLPLAYVNQPEVLVASEGYHVVVTTNIGANRMAG